jgi:streptogramin lyase
MKWIGIAVAALVMTGMTALLSGRPGEVRAASLAAANALLVADAGFTEYVAPGNPAFVAVESVDRIWFTLPAQNQIGQLVPSAGTVYTYGLPTSNAEPYRIAFAANAVWFTERAGNNIGRLDPQTGTVSEFAIPTAGVQPSGIAVLAGTPTTVWFTENLTGTVGNGLAKLVGHLA